jgi:hypothetical protein
MVNCDTNALALSAKCFDCLSPVTLLEVQTYLLAVIAGVSTDPNTLAAAAKSFQSLNPSTLAEVRVYLLCQIANAL